MRRDNLSLSHICNPGEPCPHDCCLQVDDGNFTAGQWVRVFAGTPDGRELQLSARVANLSSDWIELDRPLPFSSEPLGQAQDGGSVLWGWASHQSTD